MQLEICGTMKIIFISIQQYITFSFTEKNMCLMSLKNEDYKEQLVEQILRLER